jgi:hypothetical protein
MDFLSRKSFLLPSVYSLFAPQLHLPLHLELQSTFLKVSQFIISNLVIVFSLLLFTCFERVKKMGIFFQKGRKESQVIKVFFIYFIHFKLSLSVTGIKSSSLGKFKVFAFRCQCHKIPILVRSIRLVSL